MPKSERAYKRFQELHTLGQTGTRNTYDKGLDALHEGQLDAATKFFEASLKESLNYLRLKMPWVWSCSARRS